MVGMYPTCHSMHSFFLVRVAGYPDIAMCQYQPGGGGVICFTLMFHSLHWALLSISGAQCKEWNDAELSVWVDSYTNHEKRMHTQVYCHSATIFEAREWRKDLITLPYVYHFCTSATMWEWPVRLQNTFVILPQCTGSRFVFVCSVIKSAPCRESAQDAPCQLRDWAGMFLEGCRSPSCLVAEERE